jgi:hypothetical protein
LCVGTGYIRAITATGGLPPIRYFVSSGSLPDGLTLSTGGIISGTPTLSGNFSFTVTATAVDGSFTTKNYRLSVLNIETTSITGYTVGTPYSFTLLASGGSGMYNWSISSGTLPDGLNLNGDTGVISGTPTGGAGSGTVEFRLIDTACEAAVQTLQKPSISMTTRSTTQIATVLGYDEFIASTPPKRYHTASWSGTSEQKLMVNGVQIGGAKYEYSGQDHVDASGTVDNTHSKLFSAQCNNTTVSAVQIQGNDAFGQSVEVPFKGYYGMAVQIPGFAFNPNFLCPTSSIPYDIVGDIAINGTFDKSDLWGAALVQGTVNIGISDFVAQDSVTKTSTDTGTSNVIVLPYCPDPNRPFLFTIPSDFFTPGIVQYDNSYSCILQDEYTDAEALTNARVIVGNSNVAQNLPRTTGFVSTFTNVVFTLNTTNLVAGQDYLVSVDFADLTNGTSATRQYGFQADATGKHSITDVVPTPAAGHTLVVRNPRIAFTT